MGQDLYKEISNANIGKIVRDAAKGVSIDSIWGEMTSLFPEHFSADITNQVDQIVRAFDVLKAARADVAKSVSFADMSPEEQFKTTEMAYENVIDTAHKMVESLRSNIASEADAIKTEFEIDVKVNTESIISDIQNAINQAGAGSGEAIKVNLDINQNEIETQIRNAIQSISSSDEPLNIRMDVNRQSLEADIQTALHDIELPVQFRVDASDIERQIRAAVSAIDDIQIDVHVNADSVRNDIQQQFNRNPVQIPTQNINNAAGVMQNINYAGQQGQTIFSALGGTFREAFQTFTLANLMEDAIYRIIDVGRTGIETVKSIDDAMLDLQMATGENRASVGDMIQGYNELGQELGALTTEVSSSADTWLRQGRNMDETNQLIRDSMVLSKIGQVDSETSSEILTATINGFQMAANEASHINDVLSSIDLASASSVEGIGKALTKTASMANNAGVSLEKTAAIIATIKDVTQDSDESVGNAVKSVLSRMNQIKAGKFVDAETGEALNDVEKVLNKVGISMRDANGQFMESEPILDSVAAKWKTFDKNTQKAVATAMAGTFQYNKLTALFDNYDKVQKYTSLANNADGAAEEKFTNYADSLEAKTKSLQASLEALATDTLSSEVYAGFLDSAKAMSDFAQETDLVKTALAGVATAGTTYAFTQLASMIGNTVTQVAELGGGLRGLWQVLSGHPVALVTAGVTAAVGVWNAYRASVEEAVKSAKMSGDAWEQSNTSIQDNISKITELRTALDSGKLTEQEAYDTKSQLLDIQNQLSESYGSQAEGIDLVNGSLDEQIAKLKELNIAQSERFLNENQKGIEEATRQMEKQRHTYLGQFSPYAQDADKLQSIIDKYADKGISTDPGMDGTVYVHFKGDATQANEVLNDFMTDIRNASDETGNIDLFDGFTQNASAGLDEAKSILEEYQDLYNQSLKADIQTNKKDYGGKTASEWLNNYAKAVENYNNAV
ncbi:MAG: phage tail tape measure protein, partial [Blautia sp.]|nr:phage tail tape measure protein [Blautia sp.]